MSFWKRKKKSGDSIGLTSQQQTQLANLVQTRIPDVTKEIRYEKNETKVLDAILNELTVAEHIDIEDSQEIIENLQKDEKLLSVIHDRPAIALTPLAKSQHEERSIEEKVLDLLKHVISQLQKHDQSKRTAELLSATEDLTEKLREYVQNQKNTLESAIKKAA